MSTFDEPSSNIISSEVCAAFKKQITLLTTDPDSIPIALAPGFHGRSLSDIKHTVNFIFCSVFPGDLPGKHFSIFSEVCFYSNIHLDRLSGCIVHNMDCNLLQ